MAPFMYDNPPPDHASEESPQHVYGFLSKLITCAIGDPEIADRIAQDAGIPIALIASGIQKKDIPAIFNGKTILAYADPHTGAVDRYVLPISDSSDPTISDANIDAIVALTNARAAYAQTHQEESDEAKTCASAAVLFADAGYIQRVKDANRKRIAMRSLLR